MGNRNEVSPQNIRTEFSAEYCYECLLYLIRRSKEPESHKHLLQTFLHELMKGRKFQHIVIARPGGDDGK